jgi:1-acyl-sn-glycerol-3-phosphate acyltransferase
MIMKKIIAYFLTPFYLLSFGLVLLLFQPLQWLAFHVFGYKAQQGMVYRLNWGLMRCIHIMGGRVDFRLDTARIPADKPLIFAANHQSMNDIPAMIWFLRQYRPVFIAKQELSKGIPSISYNYKCGGAIGINRKDSVQARQAIEALGKRVASTGESVCIFPEGTRSRDGQLKAFQPGGIKTLLQAVPDAVIIPIHLQNSWKLVQDGFWPVPVGIHLRWQMLSPIACGGLSGEEAVAQLESQMQTASAQVRHNK